MSNFWRYFCEEEQQFIHTTSDEQPTQCVNNVSHTILEGSTANINTRIETLDPAKRYIKAKIIFKQEVPINLADGNQTLTLAQFLNSLIITNPTSNQTITLPDLSAIQVYELRYLVKHDAMQFNIINISPNVITVAMGSSGTSIGNMQIPANTSAMFRFRLNDSNSYEIYRLC